MARVVQGVVKGVSASIGLAVEKRHDRKDRKAALALQERSATEPIDTSNIADDEEDWALDEIADPPSYEVSEQRHRPNHPDRSVSELVEDSMSHAETPSSSVAREPQQLRYPIVIPQRRPGTKTRGFARAYPPDLETFGIDQVAFMSFLENLQSATQGSPWLRAIQVSAAISGFAPSAIAMAVSAAVQVAAAATIEVQGRYKTNAFLDRINQELFMPLGLFAMIIVYVPDTPGTSPSSILGVENINLETAKHITKWGVDKDSSLSSSQRRALRGASGETTGEAMMPLEVAPLIYPGLDAAAERPELVRDESFKERMKRNGQFVQDYFDRRSQAKYIHKNPDTTLAKAQTAPQFRSRFADPNDPVASGSALGSGNPLSAMRNNLLGGQQGGSRGGLLRQQLLQRDGGRTGGLGAGGALGDMIRGRLEGSGLGNRLGQGRDRGGPLPGNPIEMLRDGVKKARQKNVLYLTIVNMPSAEELERARQVLQAEGRFGNVM